MAICHAWLYIHIADIRHCFHCDLNPVKIFHAILLTVVHPGGFGLTWRHCTDDSK